MAEDAKKKRSGSSDCRWAPEWAQRAERQESLCAAPVLRVLVGYGRVEFDGPNEVLVALRRAVEAKGGVGMHHQEW